ncbi:MAG: imidazole glycerol phosphate synthase subunit HisH [Desulfobacterales bacterium]|nr:imidazole glycerol phosphate synthase subunit HisH [Desulfobacterales bacterium]
MIAIIDYNAGNLTSVERAISNIGYKCIITKDIQEIEKADRIIFPGVGAAGSAMKSLVKTGLDKAIKNYFYNGKPILGICLGTQIIMSQSEENNTECLGLINGCTKAFSSNSDFKQIPSLKVPHMGWNSINLLSEHPVFSSIKKDDEFYFVHSYYPFPDDYSKFVLGVTDYGISFPSIIGYKNMIATQFHAEKSGRPGLEILKNFCKWEPSC